MLLKVRMAVLIILLYTAANPHGKGAVVEKSEKIVVQHSNSKKN
jgi:hypothetical protein